MEIKDFKITITTKSFVLILLVYFVFLLVLQFSVHLKELFRPFRKDFMYTLYYHSQWFDPESKYGIGDDGLYQVAGHTLVTKNEFFTINPEMPILGKYIYGYSIILLGNAEKAALIMFFMSLAIYYLIIKQIYKDIFLRIISLLFFITDPLIFGQSFITMLDLPQLLFLLMHILSFFLLLDKKKLLFKQILFIAFSGASLGLFISVKIAFLAVVIIMVDLFFLFKNKKLWFIFPIILTAILIYTGTYLGYFLQGHSLLEFLKNQKWMLNFYLSSQIQPVYGTVISALFMGKIIGWDRASSWSQIAEWTIIWPFYLFTFLATVAQFVFKKIKLNQSEMYMLFLTSGLLSVYFFLPFFTRYLVLIIPLFIYFFVRFIYHAHFHNWIKYVSIIMLFCIHYYLFWHL